MSKKIIEKFKMLSHPEGGYYAETYRSVDVTTTEFGERSLCTGIYFLLEALDVSHLHRIKSDEMWHFYDGDPLVIVEIDEAGKLISTILGRNLENGEVPQYVVKANRWFGSYPAKNSKFSFVGCTVSFGFDFADFEMAKRDELIAEFPAHREIITKLT
ncbi:hypothetical protein A9Q84_10335 [Halobacteriovorax marinus]|uniref:DUF985 domain-containing protein n=1 Tax=Halobacteriovorax marinus TaxID=97084 RepID=A0A1Y5FD04_9BACT|nr:hypothetical protein A9Q84_10335 [Halobacteriovorax marinus]